MMAASCTFLAKRAETLFLNRVPSVRNTHSQSQWEELLAAAGKKLEEAFLEYRVRKAVPSWLPFLPNCSFWIPSSEETIKNLQGLAERSKVSKPSRKDRECVSIYKPPPNWSSSSSSSEQGKIGAISKVSEWSLIQHTDRLLSGAGWGKASGQASSSGQVAYHKFSSVRSYATAQAINVKELDCSPELKNLHERFTSEVQGKRTVPLALLRNILEQSHSSEDVNLAFQTLQDYRIYRSSKARVKQNFNHNISLLAVSASLRSGSYGLGLKALWKHNIFGLSPTIENAHMFLSHARKEKDMDLMKKTWRTMVKNLVLPTTQTADIVIRTCKDNGDLNLMFNLASEFLQNGVLLNSAVFDILIATAANFGSVEKVFEAQKFREDAGLDHTIASAFALAKAHILQGEPQIGADLIVQHCNDKVKVNKYLAMLVRVWPSELVARKEQAQIEVDDGFTEQLKDNVLLFAKALSKKFRGVSIDAEQEFGKGAPNSNKGAD